MRFSYIIALGLVLVAIPGTAQAEKKVYGAYTCAQQVPCEQGSDVSASQWAAYGNSCINEAFGYTSPDGFFNDVLGLDGSNCLTALPNRIPNYVGSQLDQTCCVIAASADKCLFRCTLTAN